MDQGFVVKRKVNPKENTNIFSLLLFCYVYPLYRKSFNKDLEEDDVFHVMNKFSSRDLGDKLEKIWKNEKLKFDKPSVVKIMFMAFGKGYLLLGLYQLIAKLIFVIVTPMAMGKVVLYFTPNQTELSKEEAYFYAVLVVVTDIAQCIFLHNYQLAKVEFALQMRTAFSALIYRKSLKLNSFSSLTGQIVTLLSKDIETFDYAVIFANDLLVEMIQAFVILYLFYLKVGVTAFISFSLFLFIIPMQLVIGKFIYQKRTGTNKKSDERLQITQEFLSAVQIIKMYTWESFFERKTNAARKTEIKKLREIFMLKEFSYCVGGLFIRLSFFILVITYTGFGNTLTPEIIYYVKSCYHKLRRTIIHMVPLGINQSAELLSSLRRMENVLNAKEFQSTRENTSPVINPKLNLIHVHVKFSNKLILADINMSLENGLHVMVGPVGSGKSSIVKSILHEYPVDEGKVVIDGSISYASQDPWLFPSSIRQNILFGQEYDEIRYKKVLHICALEMDLESLSIGDMTIIGDCSVNLSKGQQARINLARAIYKESDIYLLDDCLSSLDTHVKSYIFQNCIRKYLKNKLCIMVTHNGDFIKDADQVIIVDNGKIKYCGDPNQIPGNANFLEEKTDEFQEILEQVEDITEQREKAEKLYTSSEANIYHEVKKSGKVDWSVYQRYFMFGGKLLLISMVILCVASEATDSYGEKLVSKWVNAEANLSVLKSTEDINSTEYEAISQKGTFYFHLFTGMIISSTFILLIAAFIQYMYSAKISINLHKCMVSNIFNASMKFFDTHMIGNILNRFSKDLYIIDERMPHCVNDGLRVVLILSGSIVLIATVNIFFMVFCLMLLALFTCICMYYLPTGRSLQRLDGATRSPIVGHINATLVGLVTIRAFKTETLLRNEFDRHQDLFTSTHHMLKMSSRALGFLLSFICSFFVAFVIGRFLLFEPDQAGNVGLAISQAIMLSGLLGWGVRQWVELESAMTCVERALEYSDVEKESKSGAIVEKWPSKGSVSFQNISLSYKADHRVLKNLNFVIKPNEKVGIVGRTGAGKSSILLALFRLYEVEGQIIIDDVDIKDLSLEFLRKNIALIPQDPELFSGSVRSNIDPFEKYRDDQIWRALEEVNLLQYVKTLESDVSGYNFSVGQKQLLCLARAIIRKTKIIILDEATANMDEEMDGLVHKKIQQLFKYCTVITVAHRLHTVMDSDKILVMDKGKVVEFDSPQVLLSNSESLFHKMVKKAGIKFEHIGEN